MRRWMIFLLLLLFFAACQQTEEPNAVGFLRDNFAFIPYQERVQIIDVADETNPQFVTEFGMVQNQAIAPLQLNEQKINLKQAKHFSFSAEVAKRQIV